MMGVFRFVMLIALSLLISACSHHETRPVVVENIYLKHVKEFTRFGVDAMQQERWLSAEHAFQQALKMAKLASNPAKIIRAWYNLAMVHKAAKHMKQAEKALHKVLSLAKVHHVVIYKVRAELQLALLATAQGRLVQDIPDLSEVFSTDMHLMAAKLAYLQHHHMQAKQHYMQVIALAGKHRSGLLLQANAILGLALLAKEKGDHGAAKRQALKALKLCETFGAPRIFANAALLLAGLARDVSRQERLDYAERARDIYVILHDKEGAKKSQKIVQSLIVYIDGTLSKLERFTVDEFRR